MHVQYFVTVYVKKKKKKEASFASVDSFANFACKKSPLHKVHVQCLVIIFFM